MKGFNNDKVPVKDGFYEHQQRKMHKILYEKYRTSIDIYNVKVINEIIFNRPVRITSIFKDYLVNDEVAEFLKKYYEIEEIPHKFKKLVEFFTSYFKIFPNYVLIEGQCNSERKGKVIQIVCIFYIIKT